MNKSIPLAVAVAALASACTSMEDMKLNDKGERPGFVDVTSTAGIVTEGARSAGWADYDGDGCVDLLITQGSGSKLYQNNCNGSFTDVSRGAGITGPTGGFGVAWADFDGDRDLDLYIASADAANMLYRNNGDGTFTDVAAAAGVADRRASTGATWGDMDSDGDLDLFVANRFYPKPESDITDGLYRNNGNGTFTEVGPESGAAVPDRKTFMGAWFDYDGDGTLDLYQAVDFGNDRLYSNDGKGRFTEVSEVAGITGPAHAMGLAVGDINNDGCYDLFLSNNTRGDKNDAEHGPSTLYVNNCSGGFKDMTREWGVEDRGTVDWGVQIVDWNNDGNQDLAIVSGGMLKEGEKETNALYENRNGHLVNVTHSLGATVTGAAFGSAWADYDNDGDLDWFVANSKANSVLLENRTATGRFLRVKLKGRAGNRDGVGAQVELTAGGNRQARVIQAGKGYASSEELTPIFGLGNNSVVDRLKVTWPDGSLTELKGLKSDQTIIVTRQ